MKCCCAMLSILLFVASAAAGGPDSFPGKTSSWHGFRQFDFQLHGFDCRVVVPKAGAEGRPWIWRARFWGHEPQTDLALLNHGFHVAYCDVAGLWGNDEAIRRWDKFYRFLTTKHELSKRPALEGMSRGGLMVYGWAIRNPEKVSCIYGDAPTLGIRPYVDDAQPGDADLDRIKDWMAAHNLTLDTAKRYQHDTLDRLQPLAEHKVRIIHVCGDADEAVSFQQHTAEMERRYRRLGGPMTVIVKEGGKHHPHSLKDPAPIVAFILASQ